MERYKKTIAVVDDEADILKLICLHLKRHNFFPQAHSNATSLLKELQHNHPNLIVLDVMLPDADGIQLCQQLKTDPKTSSIPIILLTARAGESDKILGLELGADDYITKPFSPRELIARIKAVLRRSSTKKTSVIQLTNKLVINTNTYQATVDGIDIGLTTTEFRILLLLAQYPGWVMSRKQILEHIWQGEKIVTERTVDVHIKHLREKLGPEGKIIKNVRGIGYKIEL